MITISKGAAMKSKSTSLTILAMACAFLMGWVASQAQPKSGEQAAAPPKYKMTTEIPASITTPNTVETRIGALKFTDGFPDDATVEKCYDNLAFQRGVEAYLSALPAVSTEAARRAATGLGP